MGVIPLKIQAEMLVPGLASHHRMQGTERRLDQLMRYRGLQSVKNNYGTCKATFSPVEIKETYGFNYPKSKPHFFSLDKREKTEVLRGYCRDKGPKNICWALGLVRGHFVVRRQINSNEDVRLRTP